MASCLFSGSFKVIAGSLIQEIMTVGLAVASQGESTERALIPFQNQSQQNQSGTLDKALENKTPERLNNDSSQSSYIPGSSRVPFVKSPFRKDYQAKTDEVINNEQNSNNPDIKTKMDNRQRGRKMQVVGDTITNVTPQVTGVLKRGVDVAGKINMATPDPHAKIGISVALGVSKVLLTAAEGLGATVGAIITAYGRFKENSQEIASVNEQIIEAANRSDEKSQKLAKTLQVLLNPVTLKRIMGSRDSAGNQLPVTKRLLGLFTPSTYQNTYKDLMDKIYITDNKPKKWVQIQEAAENLKKEQKNYDDLIILLEIKILQSAASEITRSINKDNTLKILNRDLQTFRKALEPVQLKLENTKNTFFNRTKYNELMKQKQEMKAKIDKTRNEIAFYETNKTDKETLESKRKIIFDEINQLTKLTNVNNQTDYQQKDEANDATDKLNALQSQVITLANRFNDLDTRLKRLEH